MQGSLDRLHPLSHHLTAPSSPSLCAVEQQGRRSEAVLASVCVCLCCFRALTRDQRHESFGGTQAEYPPPAFRKKKRHHSFTFIATQARHRGARPRASNTHTHTQEERREARRRETQERGEEKKNATLLFCVFVCLFVCCCCFSFPSTDNRKRTKQEKKGTTKRTRSLGQCTHTFSGAELALKGTRHANQEEKRRNDTEGEKKKPEQDYINSCHGQ